MVMLPGLGAKWEAEDKTVRARRRDIFMMMFIPDDVCIVLVVPMMFSVRSAGVNE